MLNQTLSHNNNNNGFIDKAARGWIVSKCCSVTNSISMHAPPLSILDEQVDVDSSFPLFLNAEFADFTLTVDNKVSPEDATNRQHYI